MLQKETPAILGKILFEELGSSAYQLPQMDVETNANVLFKLW